MLKGVRFLRGAIALVKTVTSTCALNVVEHIKTGHGGSSVRFSRRERVRYNDGDQGGSKI